MTSIAARSIAATPAAFAPISAPQAAAAPDAAASDSAAPDLLADMRGAMDTADAQGAAGLAATPGGVLATGGSYISGATRTIAKLDEGIRAKQDALGQLRMSDPREAAAQEQQIEMLQKLRERIQLSIERVGDILAGRDRDDIGSDADEQDFTGRAGIDELEQRRQLLAPSFDMQPVAGVDGSDNAGGAAPDPSLVAGRYAVASH